MEQLKSGPNQPTLMSGPKFGQDDGWWSRFQKNRSNVILAIIGILIISGGVYLYSNYRQSNETADLPELSQEQIEEPGIVKPEDINIENQQNPAPGITAPEEKKATEITKKENGQYTVKAGQGAGITHLARAAVKEYLDDNPEIKQNITAEHKIYIEDYIKNKTGSYGLKIDQELTFDEGLIKEAIDESMKLNQKQLENLHQYVLLVPSLSA
jgi:hypothetical protein